MITLKLNVPVLNLDGTQFQKETLGGDLANFLAFETEGEPLKFFTWAQALSKGEDVLVDEADFEKIKSFVESRKNMTNILKAQLLKALSDCKEVSKQKLS